MIITLAWRNIWRNPVRSLVIIGAVAIGIWAALVMSGFAAGMMMNYVDNTITSQISHLQIHDPAYKDEDGVFKEIKNPIAVFEVLDSLEVVQSWSARTMAQGMLSSPKGARGVQIRGIIPEQEAEVIGLNNQLIEGGYFEEGKKNELLISRPLAEKLHVGVRKKVVLTFQNLEGDITAGAFRIKGIFDTGNNPFDNGNVFVNQLDLERLMMPKKESTEALVQVIHEVAIVLNDSRMLVEAKDILQSQLSGLKVETYREISPDLQLYESQMSTVSLIYLVIIMLALVFGIINTMLMAVLERDRELAMLMAIGMNKSRVFFTIVWETLFLSMVSMPIGLLLGWGTIAIVGNYGLDLSAYSESLEDYGISNRIFFEVDNEVYAQVPVVLAITAIIASVYPALKALKSKGKGV